MIIQFKNPIYCKADRKDIPELKKILWCKMTGRRMVFDPKSKRRRSKEFQYPQFFIDKEGYFLSGFLDRLLEAGAVDTVLNEWIAPPTPTLIPPQGILLRDDQERIVKQALKCRSGIVVSPTGSGKTILASSIVHSIKKKSLFLCHRVDLAEQTHAEFRRMGLKPTLYFAKDKRLSNLTIATIQSFAKLSPEELDQGWELIIVDEAHHCSSLDTLYGKTLRLTPSTWRFGFTATVPSDMNQEHFMTMEGLFGPIIGELSIKEGIDKGILAKPKIKILKATINKDVRDLRKYAEVYEAGVVRSYGRNKMIIDYVEKLATEGKTCLILVNEIAHGKILERIGLRAGLKIAFIYGKDEAQVRNALKEQLNLKQIDCAIATTIWKEGINIPTLDCIVNAAGGKSEIATLQSLGRGLRTTEMKSEVILVDIFDMSHNFLIKHFGERFCIYLDQEWI